MDDHNSTKTPDGISFMGALQLIFIVLKLCNLIHWKWVYVLMPTIISFGLAVIAVIAIVIYVKHEDDNDDGLC